MSTLHKPNYKALYRFMKGWHFSNTGPLSPVAPIPQEMDNQVPLFFKYISLWKDKNTSDLYFIYIINCPDFIIQTVQCSSKTFIPPHRTCYILLDTLREGLKKTSLYPHFVDKDFTPTPLIHVAGFYNNIIKY